MTLKSILSLAIASITLVAAANAEADFGRGGPGRGDHGGRGDYGRGPDRGGPGRGPDWGRDDRGPGRGPDRGPGRGPDWGPGRGPGHGPGRPYPTPPPPPHYPPQVEQKVAHVGQRVTNYAFRLRDLMGLGQQYNGYEIEQVMVDVRGSAPNTQIHLLINGAIQDVVYSTYGQIILRPRNGCILGRDIMTLDLGIQGMADIDRIYVNLRAPYYR